MRSPPRSEQPALPGVGCFLLSRKCLPTDQGTFVAGLRQEVGKLVLGTYFDRRVPPSRQRQLVFATLFDAVEDTLLLLQSLRAELAGLH